jgi:small subunit ribosomal protein S9
MIGEWNNGTGRRKSSVARVFLKKGSGKITVNGKDIQQYFGRETSIMIAKQPLVLTPTMSKPSTFRSTSMAAVNPVKPAVTASPAPDRLRRNAQACTEPSRLSTRDAREVERKKVGLHSARRASSSRSVNLRSSGDRVFPRLQTAFGRFFRLWCMLLQGMVRYMRFRLLRRRLTISAPRVAIRAMPWPCAGWYWRLPWA